MKRLRFISIIVALVMTLSAVMIFPIHSSADTVTSSGKFAGGSGTSDAPYLISNAEELVYFRDFVNTVNTGSKKYYFKLTADIDMRGYTWSEKIGITGHHFKSEFDGNGHTISNFTLTDAGFFGFVNGLSATSAAVVKGLTLADVTANFSASNSGIFIQRPHANSGPVIFEDCHVKNSTINTTAAKVGGFAGYFTVSNGHTYTFTNCSTDVTINTSKGQVGGFVGYNEVSASFTNCNSTATVIPTASISDIGGFEGINQKATSTFENCTSTLNLVSSNVTSNVGAFFGSSTVATTLKSCTAISNVDTSATNVGGFIGSATTVTIFDDCVSKGNITSTATNIGGYIGSLAVPVPETVTDPDSYTIFRGSANLTSITALKDAAGFAGNINDSYVKFIRTYNAGPIKATSTDLSNVYIAHFVATAATNAYANSRVKFSGNFVLRDVDLTGGRIHANAVADGIPSTAISNYCMIAYGGSARPFALMADHFGIDDAKYDIIMRSELFLLATEGKIDTTFRGLGDTVTVGHQEATTRNEDGTYNIRLIAAITDLSKTTGFEVTLSNGTKTKTTKVEIDRAYKAIKAGEQLIKAPEGYYFITLVIEDFDDNEYSLDFSVYTEDNKDFIKAIAGVHYIGEYDVGDDHSMKLYRGVTEQAYLKVCEDFVSNGYALYSTNTSNGNIFNTYYNTSTKTMVHAYWIEYSREMRVITANTSLLPITSTSGNNSLYDSVLLYQMEALSEDKIDGGMGFIIRLHDGRFIIIDGGDYSSSYTDNAVEIYNFLKANAPNPNKIVIAAWILTHGHTDHTNAFEGFAQKYYSNSTITIEAILFNPCQTDEQTQFANFTTDSVYSTIKSKYPKVPVYKPLSGQKYVFSKTTVEILYTMSDFLPNVIVNEGDGDTTAAKKGNGNVQTMVFMMDLVSGDGVNNNLMVLGDTTTDACNEMSARYGSYLASTYMQASHHGLAQGAGANLYHRRNNSTVEFYKYVSPQTVFWATSQEKFEERSQRTVNKYLIETLLTTNIVAADAASARTLTVK